MGVIMLCTAFRETTSKELPCAFLPSTEVAGFLRCCCDEAYRDRHGRKANIERRHSTDTAKKCPRQETNPPGATSMENLGKAKSEFLPRSSLGEYPKILTSAD